MRVMMGNNVQHSVVPAFQSQKRPLLSQQDTVRFQGSSNSKKLPVALSGLLMLLGSVIGCQNNAEEFPVTPVPLVKIATPQQDPTGQTSILRQTYTLESLLERREKQVMPEIYRKLDTIKSIQDLGEMGAETHAANETEYFVSSLLAGIEDRETMEKNVDILLGQFFYTTSNDSAMRHSHSVSELSHRRDTQVTREVYQALNNLKSVRDLPAPIRRQNSQLHVFLSALLSGIEDRPAMTWKAFLLLNEFYGPKPAETL